MSRRYQREPEGPDEAPTGQHGGNPRFASGGDLDGPVRVLLAPSTSTVAAFVYPERWCRGPYGDVMARANRDLDQSAARFLRMLGHTKAGLELQHRRVVEREASAPRLNVTPEAAVYEADDEGNDLDYYIYELARLRAMGTSIAKVFGDQTLADAGEALEAAIPALRTIRNPLTHPNDDDRLDDVVWFGSLVRLKPDGRVEYLIDPRNRHHDLAMAYAEQLLAFLRGKVKDAIAADPPLPIDEQIKRRADGT